MCSARVVGRHAMHFTVPSFSSLDLAAVEALPKPAPQTSAEASNYVAYIPIPMEEGDDDYVDDEAEADFRSDFGSEGRHSKTPFLVPLVVVPKDEVRYAHEGDERMYRVSRTQESGQSWTS